MSFWIFCLKCLTGALLAGVIIILSRETAHLGIGYHGTTKNVLRHGLRMFEESATPVSRGFFGDHFETSCLIKCSGSSRKNLQGGSVLIKFFFVQEKPARKPPAVRENKLKQSEAIRNLPKMHSASTTEENLGDAENWNWNF